MAPCVRLAAAACNASEAQEQKMTRVSGEVTRLRTRANTHVHGPTRRTDSQTLPAQQAALRIPAAALARSHAPPLRSGTLLRRSRFATTWTCCLSDDAHPKRPPLKPRTPRPLARSERSHPRQYVNIAMLRHARKRTFSSRLASPLRSPGPHTSTA